ncbi:MAG: TlpA disulfide reductase family protein [Alphaproteobacteria bacterium]
MPRISLIVVLYFAITFNAAGAASKEKRPHLPDGVGQFIYLQPIQKAQLPAILDPQGHPVDFGTFRGKVVLLNLWATWCGPCIYEMPALDRLQTKLDSSQFTIIPVSIGADDTGALKAFYSRHGVSHLPAYRTAQRLTTSEGTPIRSGNAVLLYSLPMTYVIDASGRSIGYFHGIADWDADETIEFLNSIRTYAASLPR